MKTKVWVSTFVAFTLIKATTLSPTYIYSLDLNSVSKSTLALYLISSAAQLAHRHVTNGGSKCSPSPHTCVSFGHALLGPAHLAICSQFRQAC